MTQLPLAERCEIFALKKHGSCNSEIARTLGRDKSTITRELKRNADGRSKNYHPELAHKKTIDRHLHKNKHKAFTARMQESITYWLEKDYSPEQIKGDAINNKRPCVSIERIYQFIWQDKKQGGELYRHLRTQGRRYQKRGKKAGRGLIPNRTCISQRPEVVDRKSSW
jgi:IS30 family transposase